MLCIYILYVYIYMILAKSGVVAHGDRDVGLLKQLPTTLFPLFQKFPAI